MGSGLNWGNFMIAPISWGTDDWKKLQKVWAQRDSIVVKVFALHTPESHIVLILEALLPIQIPACGLGKQSRMAQNLGTLHQRGRPRRAPGSWLQIGATPAVAYMGSESSDGRFSCLSSSLYIPDCNCSSFVLHSA